MKWVAIATVSAVIIGGCDNPPVATGTTSNPTMPVALLFEHEGCRVFRFLDGGRSHYYVRCADGTRKALSTQNCGKNCRYSNAVSTLNE